MSERRFVTTTVQIEGREELTLVEPPNAWGPDARSGLSEQVSIPLGIVDTEWHPYVPPE